MTAPRQVWPPEFEARYEAAGHWTEETLPGFFRERAEAAPEAPAVRFGGGTLSYADVDRASDAVAGGLRGAGFRPGERIVLQLPNIPQFFSAMFGAMRAGLLPVYALPAHRRQELEHFVDAAEATGYITVDRHAGFDYRGLARELGGSLDPSRVFVVGESDEFRSFAELEGATARDLVEPDAAEVAFLQLSGGSTGLSKLIPRTHRDYVYTLRESARICGLTTKTVYLGALPIAHNFPMSSPGTLGTFYAGGAVSLSPSPSPDAAFPIIERDRATITGVVPPMAIMWARAAGKTPHDLSSLEVLQVGGARFAPEAARRIEPALDVHLQQVYGMAEGLVNYTRLDDPLDVRVNTQGRPISDDDEIRLVDAEERPVAPGEQGHLLTRGPYTIRAYHADAETNRRAFTEDGFYRTGDLVSVTEDGNLIVHGRVSDVINRGGEKIPVEEVENHLMAHAGVHDAVLVPVPDPYLGEKSCAVVVPEDPAPTALELRRWIRERGLAAFKIPDDVMFLDAFPSTGVGKVSRRDLRAAVRVRISSEAPNG
ncbi:MAG: AMP-binding protein [Gemmatimonadetes bacterium]|nr:AMP-binding protein [Gemmatimonadota bacterium]